MSEMTQWVPVIAALSGVLVGFLLGFIRDWWDGRKQRRRLSLALLVELRTFMERYDEAFGTYIRLLEADKPLDRLSGALRQGFFAVFDGNTAKIGLFRSKDAEKIVRAYILAKGHLDSLTLAFAMIRDGAYLKTLTEDALVKAASGLKKESAAFVSAAQEAIAILSAQAGESGQ